MALIRATYFLFTARGVFEASPEGGLERGVFFNAGCGSESEYESKWEKNRAELHFSFQRCLLSMVRRRVKISRLFSC